MPIQPIEFAWIKNGVTRSNLKELSKTLGKNEHFEVDQTDQTIKIVRAQGFSKLVYFFQKNRKNREVKELISKNIIQLANDLPQQGLDVDQQIAVREFFFGRLASLSKNIFDRSVLGDALIVDKNSLPQILNPELAKLNKAQKLQRRIEKAKLSRDLGIELKPISKGASGSYFVRDHKMKIIGVFKPGSEESTSVGTPKLAHRIKNCIVACFGVNRHEQFWPGSGYVSEKLTTVMADHLNIDVVPRADITQLASKKFASANEGKIATVEEGSFQVFAPGTKSADEYLKLNSTGAIFGNLRLRFNAWRYKDRITAKISQADFEKLAITDGLILNKDRHFENWLIKKNAKSEDDRTHGIVLIDNQMAFPKVNPSVDDGGYRRQQNKWAALPQAEKRFSMDARHDTAIALRGENLKRLLEELQKASEVQDAEIGAFNEVDNGSSQEFAFKQRTAVLLYAFEKDLSIREYAEIKSLDEMIAFTAPEFDLTDVNALNDYLGLN